MRTKYFFSLTAEYVLGAFKWLLGIFMLLEGVETMFSPVRPLGTGTLGFIYGSRTALVVFGTIFLLCGAALLYGKARRSKQWVGIGLMSIYLCFVFAATLQFAAQPTVLIEWLPNLIASLIVGALWLRWKFQTQYINPKHFTRDIQKLSQ